jgi:hypothetical protein
MHKRVFWQCRADGVIATERFFCRRCGSMLWGEDRRYPTRVYPFASSLDCNIPRVCPRMHACDSACLTLKQSH